MTVRADEVLRIGGVRVDMLTMQDAVEAVCVSGLASRPLATHLVNAYTLSLAARDRAFAELLDRGGLNLPDGMPLVWLARRRGVPLPDRIYGPDLTLAVCDVGRAHGLRHYLYGGAPGVAARFADELRARYPGVEIVGAESPPYRALDDDEEAALVQRVLDAGAQVVWVGLGTPKQDVFVDRFRDRIGRPIVAVGAAFDFLTGQKRMAPAWMQRHGLEWLFRLVSEPRRLWRRYLVGNVVFLWMASRKTTIEAAPSRPWLEGDQTAH